MELIVHQVSKAYNKGKVKALDNVTLTFTPGIYGLLGPNGAGKSTLLNIMTDNLRPDAGEVTFNGVPVARLGRQYRNILGYMPQQQGLFPEFSGRRFLWYMAALKGLSRKAAGERIEQLLGVVHLERDAHRKLGGFSGGMKQRILIAQALLNDPQVLILDEPTAGLDPQERIRIRNLIAEIALDKIVILATHVVPDIEFIAKQVILLHKGKVLLQEEPAGLLRRMEGKVFEARIPAEQLKEAQRRYRIGSMAGDRDGVCVRIVGDEPPAEWESVPVRPNLEDVYLDMLGE
jgi:ABC-type multidrug transport system ATPase subunit